MTSKARRFLSSVFCPGVAVLLALASPEGATAATFTVTNLADTGPGSLRQAVLDANAWPGADEVAFAPGLTGTILLTSGEIVIADSLVVNGPGAGSLTVDAGYASRIFHVFSPAAAPIDVTLSALTLTRGYSAVEGGAVLTSENLTVLDSVISDSKSGYVGTYLLGCGGNVALSTGSIPATLRIVNSTLTGGEALGPADEGGNLCVSSGRLILERSTVSGGSAPAWGGGISLWSPAENSVILDSTISGNTAGSGGGIAVRNFSSLDLMIESSTISGNSAESLGGGGIYLVGPLLLRLTTVLNNSAPLGGSILSHSSLDRVQLDHSILANGTPEDLAEGTVTANYSLIESPGSTTVLGANNQIGIDPLLGPLTNNGGPTLTHSPLPGSPVINTGDPAIPDPPPGDQRGFARIVGPAIDRGSVEAQQQIVITEVPTLSQWAMLFLSALLFAAGVRRLRGMGTALLLALVFAKGAMAATFTVHNLADSGPGSLRQAVLEANASPGADEVVFTPGLNGTITLTSGEIVITDSLIVTGPEPGALTVSGNDQSRIFRVESPAAPAIDVTLSGLTLTRGATLGEGGAIVVYDENLTIHDSVISDSSSGSTTIPFYGCGGSVAWLWTVESATGTLRIVNSSLIGGIAWGQVGRGGNLCIIGGRLILERSTVAGGSAFWGGGMALLPPAENSVILNSTISGNHAASGGGINAWQPGSNLRIESSTISGNSARQGGGGIDVWVIGGPLPLRLTTVTNNSAREGGNIRVSISSPDLPQIQLDHSIVANGTPEDLLGGPYGAPVTANYSLIESPGNMILLGANNLIGVDPLLGPLTNNGGPTQTHSPLPGSPVINTGDPAIPDPPPGDQRGFARIVGPAIDRGSVEAQQQIVITEVPTLSQWAMLVLSTLLFAAGIRRLRRTGLALLLALVFVPGAAAATFTVVHLADSGPGSLRQAVLDANAAAGPDEVAFTPGLTGTITLTSGEIVITDSLIVAGPGAGALTVDADYDSRIFRVDSPAAPPIDVTLSGLTLTRGFSGGEGGAVVAYDENLTILDSVISEGFSGAVGTPLAYGCGGNVAFIASPAPSTETLRIVNSTLTDGTAWSIGTAWGGNLCVEFGRLILERSTISGGSTPGWGGGVQLTSPEENSAILNSTISGNTAGSGGGIFVWSPSSFNLTIESSTLSGNSAEVGGGGIFLFFANGPLLLRLATVSNNSAGSEGGSIYINSSLSQVQLDHSIVANGTPEDLATSSTGTVTVTANYSLIEAPGEVLISGANNLIGIDPLLGPLTNNGGPTLTHSPLPGSPVINTGDPAIPDPPPGDQRGFARIVGPAIDRGSVEAQQQLAITEVPTLSQWAMLVLSTLLFAAGVWRLRRTMS